MPKQITLPDNATCLLIYADEEGINFSLEDTLDLNTNDAKCIAGITRGMIECAVKNPTGIYEIGVAALLVDNGLDETGFPETVGNA